MTSVEPFSCPTFFGLASYFWNDWVWNINPYFWTSSTPATLKPDHTFPIYSLPLLLVWKKCNVHHLFLNAKWSSYNCDYCLYSECLISRRNTFIPIQSFWNPFSNLGQVGYALPSHHNRLQRQSSLLQVCQQFTIAAEWLHWPLMSIKCQSQSHEELNIFHFFLWKFRWLAS